MAAMLNAFQDHVDHIRIIRSKSGRPDKCVFQPVTKPPEYQASADYIHVVLKCNGYAKRIGEAEAMAIAAGRQSW
jgi:hypothetical protein